jgi:DNA-binding XRE family transcriptional regulator
MDEGAGMKKVSVDVKRNYRNRVLEMRLKAGYAKQKKFASRLGISPTILCDIETNKRFLSSIYAIRIKQVLNCSLDDLYEINRLM